MGRGSGFGLRQDESGMKPDGRDLEDAMARAVEQLPEGVLTQPDTSAQEALEQTYMAAPTDVGPGEYTVQEGKLMHHNAHTGQLEAADVTGSTEARIIGQLGLRQTAQRLFAALYANETEEAEALRKQLNQQYDAFVEEHGKLHELANVRAFAEDAHAGLVLALEQADPKAKAQSEAEIDQIDEQIANLKATKAKIPAALTKRRKELLVAHYGKADLFTGEAIRTGRKAHTADGPVDALGIVLNDHGGDVYDDALPRPGEPEGGGTR